MNASSAHSAPEANILDGTSDQKPTIDARNRICAARSEAALRARSGHIQLDHLAPQRLDGERTRQASNPPRPGAGCDDDTIARESYARCQPDSRDAAAASLQFLDSVVVMPLDAPVLKTPNQRAKQLDVVDLDVVGQENAPAGRRSRQRLHLLKRSGRDALDSQITLLLPIEHRLERRVVFGVERNH